ncbi:DUF3667 domain-containing protein [Polaribacter cellanae]|uniref:DUF3667 domain-containing protein n=1 Tax=Polaribacter cellanae TaxID=2818493 RepID=A0A975HAK3_9FLAO|nr:DUF3667 domain-containing protein [Polaribacter cellanae]
MSTNNTCFIKLTKSKKNLVKIKDPECLNCGYPFNGQEKFCPDCGQANKGNNITFKNFIHEVFNGLFNFDAKFWNTFIPLLINPGSVSRNYIEGKRQRYSNPFRFYLTVSIIFFLIVGIFNTKEKYKSLVKENKADIAEAIKKENSKSNKKLTEKDLDSIKKELNKKLKNSYIPIPEKTREKILNEIEKEARDSANTKYKKGNININLGGDSKIEKFINYDKEHPNSNIDVALHSLGYEKTFLNRFMYTRAATANSLVKKDNREQFLSQLLSYGSVALFVFLPLFTLFLKLFYIRRKYTYVDHLIFVFHVQTVFFMLFSIYFLLEIFGASPALWVFTILFLVYLFIAMKKFYQQGYFKTFIKFLLLNLNYSIIAIIGIVIVFLLSFAMY